MQRIDILTSLPSRLSCIIMQDWLDLKSVMKLNSAYCCEAHRRNFTDLVRSDEYFVHEEVTFESWSNLFHALPMFGEKLRSVAFAGRLSPEHEQLVIENCHNLTRVRFRGYNNCTHKLCCVLGNKIVLLNISETFLDYSLLQRISQLCSNVRTLGLAHTRLTNDMLTEITKACPFIVLLDIAHNNELTDSAILSMVVGLKSLRGLNIEGCASLTDASLVHIYTHSAGTLHTLQMNCREITYRSNKSSFSVSAINALLEHCTQLHTFCTVGSYRGNATTTINISPIAVRNVSTLILQHAVYVDMVDATPESCVNLHTIVTDVLYSVDCLIYLARQYFNLKEVRLVIGSQYESKFYEVVDYVKDMRHVLERFKPGLVVKCIHPHERDSIEQVAY